jgi:Ni/Co efflux regulator RcnB
MRITSVLPEGRADYVLSRVNAPPAAGNWLNGTCLKTFSPGSGAAPDSAPQGRFVRSVREIEMKRLFAATALALTLVGGVVTTAQADHRDRNRYEHRHDRHDDRNYDRRDWDRSYGFRHHDGRRYDYGRYVRPSGYHYRTWRYGDYLPRGYYSRRYIVNNYYAYRLRPPPRGYHYVRVDHDVVLAAIASGVVVSAIYGIFH